MTRNEDKKRLWVWWLVFGVLIFVVASLLSRVNIVRQVAETDQPGLYRVVRFDDGDTIVVDMNGTEETVRFIGVDTPETHHPKRPVECYGKEASLYTKSLIGSRKVRLQADSLDTNRDRYGRLLRYVYLTDGTLVDEKLIAEGFGFAYTFFPFEKSKQFVIAENQAERGNRGLWGACQIIDIPGGHHTAPTK